MKHHSKPAARSATVMKTSLLMLTLFMMSLFALTGCVLDASDTQPYREAPEEPSPQSEEPSPGPDSFDDDAYPDLEDPGDVDALPVCGACPAEMHAIHAGYGGNGCQATWSFCAPNEGEYFYACVQGYAYCPAGYAAIQTYKDRAQCGGLGTIQALCLKQGPKPKAPASCQGLPPNASGVLLFEHQDHAGKCRFISTNTPDLKPLGINDLASSLRFVGKAKSAVLFKDDHYKAKSMLFAHDCPDLKRHNNHGMGDLATSLTVKFM
jgi:hypothetical protein